MKKMFLKVMGALILGNAIILSGCSKKEDGINQPPPGNPPPVSSRFVQWTMESLPGLPNAPVNDLFAIVSVENEQGQSVLLNQKLAINFAGRFKTQELELPSGNHKVTGFLITDVTGRVLMATPKTNSARATGVSRPLPINFRLPQPVLLGVAMELLHIQPGDTPESFGYPAGTFNNPGQNPPPGEGNGFIKIKLKAAIQVGEVSYDSIPGSVLYTSWDENQQQTARYIPLAAGANELALSRSAVKHHFRLTKWGADYELELRKEQLQDGNLYMIGGSKAAKKLKAELVYTLVNGTYKPETRTVFTYAAGRLAEIQYYARRQDNTPYLQSKELFEYNSNRVQKISRYNEYNNMDGFISFTYNAAGQVSRILDETAGVQTTATVGYHYNAATKITEVLFNYTYSHTANPMNYYQRYYGGNRIEDNSNTANNNTETGRYEFDTQINPYVHMGWPNLFLSNNSKNNVKEMQKTYYGHYPTAVPYSFSYSYDMEGYPVELIRQYKSYLTGQHLFTTKTVFQY